MGRESGHQYDPRTAPARWPAPGWPSHRTGGASKKIGFALHHPARGPLREAGPPIRASSIRAQGCTRWRSPAPRPRRNKAKRWAAQPAWGRGASPKVQAGLIPRAHLPRPAPTPGRCGRNSWGSLLASGAWRRRSGALLPSHPAAKGPAHLAGALGGPPDPVPTHRLRAEVMMDRDPAVPAAGDGSSDPTGTASDGGAGVLASRPAPSKKYKPPVRAAPHRTAPLLALHGGWLRNQRGPCCRAHPATRAAMHAPRMRADPPHAPWRPPAPRRRRSASRACPARPTATAG